MLRKLNSYANTGLLSGLLVSAGLFSSAVTHAASVDLSGWTAEGGESNWSVQAGNDTVHQLVNGSPTVFFDPASVGTQGTALSGKITVTRDPTGDDDFIGFVLGYNSGEISSPASDYFLIDWKQRDQCGKNGELGKAGIAISRVSDSTRPWYEFWDHTGGVQEIQRGATLHSTGWADETEYTFSIVFTDNLIELTVDGSKELSITPADVGLTVFEDGSFGFYNMSQANVLYSAIVQATINLIANAGPDQSVSVGAPVSLNGSDSYSPDGAIVTGYSWSFVSLPMGSNAALLNPGAVNPGFTPDICGSYELELVVSDAEGNQSLPDSVLIEALATGSGVSEPYVLDFEGLPTGTFLSQVYGKNSAGDSASVPVQVRGLKQHYGSSVNAAVVFDSSNPTGSDFDLGTPNEQFGGPGRGANGSSNTRALGKILIVDEHPTRDNNNDGLADDPDDSQYQGNKLTFNFTDLGPVTVYSVDIIDTNEHANEALYVDFYDESGVQIGNRITAVGPGDNGVATLDLLATPGVQTMVVSIDGSGAIDNIVYAQENGAPTSCPASTTPANPGNGSDPTNPGGGLVVGDESSGLVCEAPPLPTGCNTTNGNYDLLLMLLLICSFSYGRSAWQNRQRLSVS
jgi:hypothetical protein